MAKIEVFTAGTFLCEEMVIEVQELACSKCDVTVYNLNKRHASSENIVKAKLYGVQMIPSVAINGKVIDIEKVKNARLHGLKQNEFGIDKTESIVAAEPKEATNSQNVHLPT
ncbi:glutaredoxin [Paenibacillus sp. PR3]|uniref:Glutaredoxin n=1 Tax=Paenibacillus terricola TaxID=2763503 RepID=A0ABR8MSZ0_9BACL|nr:glutaredoxin [Paenibacillus terricola]MBD3919093.1 glutaredoxin [Paenibacillus terricola]